MSGFLAGAGVTMARLSAHRVLCVMAVLAVITCTARGQPIPGNAEPRELSLGVLREGGILEGRMRVWLTGTRLAGRSAVAQGPPWLHVTRVSVESQYFGRRTGSRLYCEIEFTVEGREVGELASAMRITSGAQRIDVPLKVTVLPAKADDRRVLIVTSPFDYQFSSDLREFDAWFAVLRDNPLDVSYLRFEAESDVLRGIDLMRFHVLMLAADGIVHLTDADLGKIRRFLIGGGRLVLASQTTLRGSVDRTNAIVNPLGLSMQDLEPTGGNLVECGGDRLAKHALLEGVGSVKLMRPSPLKVTDPHCARLLVKAADLPDTGWIAAARLGRGEVIVLTQSTWWQWLSDEQFDGSDNATLLRNVLMLPVVLPPGT